ncbi:MAG: hypothetical protein LC802_07115 [Acidobacteria bacterium]|nr:hypothetical protein [Acidobacteriota bacterium]
MTSAEEAFYRSDKEVEELARRFEGCEMSPDEFKHRSHLTVALGYLLRLPYEQALARMRRSILGFIAHHAIPPEVYHETLTVFWVRRVRSFVERTASDRPLFELANELARECGDARVVDEYFSQELIASEGARAGWVEPDLKPLDF